MLYTAECMSPSGDPQIELRIGAAHPSSSAELAGPPPGARTVEWLAVAIAAFVFALYFGLVPLGQWQADEYDYFGRLRQGVRTVLRDPVTVEPSSAWGIGLPRLRAAGKSLPAAAHGMVSGAAVGRVCLLCACASAIRDQRSSAPDLGAAARPRAGDCVSDLRAALPALLLAGGVRWSTCRRCRRRCSYLCRLCMGGNGPGKDG